MAAKKEQEVHYEIVLEYKVLKTVGNSEPMVLNHTYMVESEHIPGDATAEERSMHEVAQNQKEKSIGPRVLEAVAEATRELTDFGIAINSGGFTDKK